MHISLDVLQGFMHFVAVLLDIFKIKINSKSDKYKEENISIWLDKFWEYYRVCGMWLWLQMFGWESV
jgi:hypothetical protein